MEDRTKAVRFATAALRLLVAARYADKETAISLRRAAVRYLAGSEAALAA